MPTFQGFSSKNPEDMKKVRDSVFRAPTDEEMNRVEEKEKRFTPTKEASEDLEVETGESPEGNNMEDGEQPKPKRRGKKKG